MGWLMNSGTAQLTEMRRGDTAALRALYMEHAPAVLAFVRQRLSSASDAADVVQDVFTAALQSGPWQRFSGETTFRAYLLGIARNHLLHLYRMRGIRDRAAAEPRHWVDDATVGEGGSANLDQTDLVRRLLAELTPRERSFFEHHMMERPSRRATAERFGITEEQVRYLEKKVRLRALQYLKRVGYLEDDRRGALGAPLLSGAH
jgi:RNA polymerase sigma factor (sigma-70 family)